MGVASLTPSPLSRLLCHACRLQCYYFLLPLWLLVTDGYIYLLYKKPNFINNVCVYQHGVILNIFSQQRSMFINLKNRHSNVVLTFIGYLFVEANSLELINPGYSQSLGEHLQLTYVVAKSLLLLHCFAAIEKYASDF